MDANCSGPRRFFLCEYKLFHDWHPALGTEYLTSQPTVRGGPGDTLRDGEAAQDSTKTQRTRIIAINSESWPILPPT